jgi:hydroxymethylglutaryl-CoA lyase
MPPDSASTLLRKQTLPAHIVVREVGLRDGLQSIDRIVSTSDKIQLLQSLYAAGLRHIEIGSFVPTRLLPQMADTAKLMEAAYRLEGLETSVLVPNLRGAQTALQTNARYLMVPLSASHAHSFANLRKTPDEVVAEVGRIRAERDSRGSTMLIDGGVGTAFGCTLQGHVAVSEVVRLTQGLLDAGADRISLADTVGYADPASVREVFEAVLRVAGDRLWCGHFHDTRGLGLANVLVAMELGVHRFDTCFAGIGGCPHAPNSGGNIATDDLVFMLESMGIDTGVDVHALLEQRKLAATILDGEVLRGAFWRAGVPITFSPPARASAGGAL